MVYHLIKTPLNDESNLSDVDETLPITDRNAFVDWMQNTFLISDDNLSDSTMILQLDNECGVEISWDDNESIEIYTYVFMEVKMKKQYFAS